MSHEEFVRRVNQTGGASMGLHSGRLLQPGRSGYMVGGEADRHGNPIPSWNVPESDFGAEHVEKFVDYMKGVTGSSFRDVHVGAWKNEGEVVMDSSRKVKRAKQAIRMGKNRNQISVWNNRQMKEIPTGGTGETR